MYSPIKPGGSGRSSRRSHMRTYGFLILGSLTLTWLVVNNTPTAHIPPIEGALTFISVGDHGTGGKTQYAVARQMAKVASAMKIRLVLGLGDNFYPKGVEDVNDSQFYYSLRSVYKNMRAVWFPALGHSDHKGNISAVSAYARQHKDWGAETPYYAISLSIPDGSTVELVVTDSVPLEAYLGRNSPRHCEEPKHPSFESGVYSGMRELLWMKRVLVDSTADWVIVTGHSPVWSGGLRNTCPGERAFQKEMNKIFAEAGVDVYMSARDHNAQVIMGDGNVHYMINGVGSQAPEPVVNIPGRSLMSATGFNGFAVHQLTRDFLTTTWVDQYGTIQGTSTIKSKCALSGQGCGSIRGHQQKEGMKEFLQSPLGTHESIPGFFKHALMEEWKQNNGNKKFVVPEVPWFPSPFAKELDGGPNLRSGM